MLLQRLHRPLRIKILHYRFVKPCHAPFHFSARKCVVQRDAKMNLRNGGEIDGKEGSAKRNEKTKNDGEKLLNNRAVKSETSSFIDHGSNRKVSKTIAPPGRPCNAKRGASSELDSNQENAVLLYAKSHDKKITVSASDLVGARLDASHTTSALLKDATSNVQRTISMDTELEESLTTSETKELAQPPGGSELSEKRRRMRLDIFKLNRIFKRYKKKINYLRTTIVVLYEGTAVERLKQQFLRIEQERMAESLGKGDSVGENTGMNKEPGIVVQANVIPKITKLPVPDHTSGRQWKRSLGLAITSNKNTAKVPISDVVTSLNLDIEVDTFQNSTIPTEIPQKRRQSNRKSHMDTHETSSRIVGSSQFGLVETTTSISTILQSKTTLPMIKNFTSTSPTIDLSDRRGFVLVYIYSQILDSLMFHYGYSMANLARSLETFCVERGGLSEDLVLLHHSKTMYERAIDWQLGVKDYEPTLWRRLSGANDDELYALTRLVRRRKVEM
jgi:hypothetical protein